MIWLTGPGGAGKSTAGPLLAQRLGLPFRDLDAEFTARFGNIDEYIAAHGYRAYTHANVQACELVLQNGSSGILALSSGLMTYPPDVHPRYAALRGSPHPTPPSREPTPTEMFRRAQTHLIGRLSATLLLAFCGAGAASAQSQASGVAVGSTSDSAPTADAGAVERYLREQMRLNQIPSISVAVVRDGRTELLGAYGTANLEWNAAATVTTAYQLASATKPLTGTALMLLVQEGRVALDSSVTHYLPTAPPEWRPITIRHLMTHRSGITDDLGPGAPRDAGEATTRAAARPLTFAPGSRSSYGIGGYAVAQHVVERVAGMPFPEFLRQRLLVPLGMTGTRFDHGVNDGPFRSADVVPGRAGVYRWENGAQRIFWFHFGAEAYTAGGLLSTAQDLASWAAALDQGRLLSARSVEMMLSRGAGAGADDAFGIGWVLGRYRGRPTVGHSGGPALADILRFPDEKLTIIVLANQSRMYPYLAQGVADLLLPDTPAAAPAAIPDSDPALSARLRGFLLAASQGTLRGEDFTDEARAGFVPQLQDFLLPYARALGRPGAMTLVAEETGNAARVRHYHVVHGTKPVRWRFDLAPDGRIASLRPTPE